MDLENEVAAGSSSEHIGEKNYEPSNLQAPEVPNHAGDLLRMPRELENSSHTHMPHVDHHHHGNELLPGHTSSSHGDHDSHEPVKHDFLQTEGSGYVHAHHGEHPPHELQSPDFGGHTHWPHVQHKTRDLAPSEADHNHTMYADHESTQVELRAARERIEKLQADLAHAEKVGLESHKELSDELSLLRGDLQKAKADLERALIEQEKYKGMEGENARLGKELTASTEEIGNLKRDLETAKGSHGELINQVDELKERLHKLEEELSTSDMKAKKAEEGLSLQAEAHRGELAAKTAEKENMSTAHGELLSELQATKSKVEELETTLAAASKQAEELQTELGSKEAMAKEASDESARLKSVTEAAEAKLGEAEEKVRSLEGKLSDAMAQLVESDDLKKLVEEAKAEKVRADEEFSQVKGDLTRVEGDLGNEKARTADLEENLRSMEAKLNEQEERWKTQEAYLLELQGKAAELQDSLSEAKSSAEASRSKIAELEHELTSLAQSKAKVDEDAMELQSKLTSAEEVLNKQTDSLKVAEDEAAMAKEQASQLQNVLNSTEEKLKATEEMAESLRLQSSDLKAREEKSIEQFKEAQEALQKMELDSQTKLQCSEDGYKDQVSELEEKVGQLEETLAATSFEAEGGRKKVAELELELESRNGHHHELREQVRVLQDRCSERESHALGLRTRGVELEGLITQYRNEADGATGKIGELEAALGDMEKRVQAEVEERQTEMKRANDKISELEFSIESLQHNLAGASQREAHLIEEKRLLQERMEKHAAQLENEKAAVEKEHESLLETEKAALREAVVREEKLKEEISSLQAANAKMQDVLSQMEIEKQATISDLEGAQKSFAELNKQFVEERQRLQEQIVTIMQENGDLAEKFSSTQEKLHAALAQAEVLTKQLQEGLSKEAAWSAEVEDLKVQLSKAMDACGQVEKLEESLKNSVTAEEHQAHIEKLMATSRLSESKLADTEEQLSNSKLEISRVQKAFDEQETRVKELVAKTMSAEVMVEQASPDSTKTRELEMDSQSPGKLRNRKTVTWDVDGDVGSKTRVLEKPTPHPAHSLKQFLAHVLIAVVSLTVGFLLAGKIYL